MAQNITLMGANYSAVPAVKLTKTGGGTAQFDDTTDANATASDILSGKSILGVSGNLSMPSISQDGTTKVLSIS